MSQAQSSFRQKHSASPADVDRKLLAQMISRVNDPLVARVFLNACDQCPELKQEFLGAYLTAAEALKRSHIRYAKAREAGVAAGRFKRGITRVLRSSWDVMTVVFLWALAKARVEILRYMAARRASPRPTSANVIQLPMPRKATGTDN